MRFVVAVSGGVDSVVLLDMFAKQYYARDNATRIESCTVAHFDHGIRPDSARDMAFVRELARAYGFRFETKREKLGPGASEGLARERRYAFLREVAAKQRAVIATAHHADDVLETIAINSSRGTGWRGLAVLDSPATLRPLARMRKTAIIQYANKHKLAWREDSTNADVSYLRNGIRQQLRGASDDDVRLAGLYRQRQRQLKRMIDAESSRLVGEAPYSRYFFSMIPDNVALELLRTICIREYDDAPVLSVRQHLLGAIKTYLPSKQFEVSSTATVRFTKTTFVVEVTPEVLS